MSKCFAFGYQFEDYIVFYFTMILIEEKCALNTFV